MAIVPMQDTAARLSCALRYLNAVHVLPKKDHVVSY